MTNPKLAAVAALALCVSAAHADNIDWNQWSSNTGGTIATGAGNVDMTFSGETSDGFYTSYPSWNPASTWADGTVVQNAPTGGIVRLLGGGGADAVVDTITFSQPVVDPVMAIWSLGQGGDTASFVFSNATPVFVAGGKSAEYQGQSIVVNGNTVSGAEGNGTVMFKGTYTSISWVNPAYENWYGFNVGISGVAAPVPEPASDVLLLAGLAALGLVARRRRVS